MAGLLESLSMGLRGAGAILSDDVYKSQRDEAKTMRSLEEQRRTLMAQQIIKAAESGSMDPEAAKQSLEKLGLQGLSVGPDAAAQQRQEELKRRQAIAQSIGTLTPEERSDPLKFGSVFMQHGDHATGAKFIEMAQTRHDKKVESLAKLEQRAEEMDRRSENQALDRASREEASRQADATRRVIAEGTQAVQRESMELRRVMGGQGPAPTVVEIADPNDPSKAIKIDARTRQVIGASPPKQGGDEKLTEVQSKNMLFGARAARSHDLLNGIEEKISTTGLAAKQGLGSVPLVGGALEMTANTMLSANQQKVEQAQRDFVNAVLRQESGAVISDAEFANAKKQYFPQPGDGKDVIEQKRRNRETAIAGFRRAAGPGAKDIDALRAGEPPPAQRRASDRSPVMRFDAQGNQIR